MTAVVGASAWPITTPYPSAWLGVPPPVVVPVAASLPRPVVSRLEYQAAPPMITATTTATTLMRIQRRLRSARAWAARTEAALSRALPPLLLMLVTAVFPAACRLQ